MENISSSGSQTSFERTIDKLGWRIDTSVVSFAKFVDMHWMEEKELCFQVSNFKESHGKAIQEMEDTSSFVSLKSVGMAIDELGLRTDTLEISYEGSMAMVQKEVRKIKLRIIKSIECQVKAIQKKKEFVVCVAKIIRESRR